MNKLKLINHNIFGDIMVYFFINMIMYILLIIMLYKYFERTRISILDFLLLLFNANVYLIFLFNDLNFLYGLLFSLSTIIIKKAYYYFSSVKNNKQEEVVLIKEGLINFHELVENNYSYNKLIKYLKRKKIMLDEIEYCFLKDNRLIIIKNDIIKNYPISIIIDGKVLFNNLQTINKDSNWLDIELNNKNLNVNNVDYAYFKKDKLYFITKYS